MAEWNRLGRNFRRPGRTSQSLNHTAAMLLDVQNPSGCCVGIGEAHWSRSPCRAARDRGDTSASGILEGPPQVRWRRLVGLVECRGKSIVWVYQLPADRVARLTLQVAPYTPFCSSWRLLRPATEGENHPRRSVTRACGKGARIGVSLCYTQPIECTDTSVS